MKVGLLTLLVGLPSIVGSRVAMEQGHFLSVRGLPEAWELTGRAAADEPIELLFAVRQQNLNKLEEALLAVSSPSSPVYGKHLSNDEVHALIAPSAVSLNALTEFLQAHDVAFRAVTPNSDIISAVVTIDKAELMLGAEYHTLQHSSGQKVMRCLSYSLPEEVARAVDFVSPTVHMPPPPRRALGTSASSTAAIGNTPTKLRDLYSVDVFGKAGNNRMAVTAFLKQYYNKNDLHQFWSLFCAPTNLTCGKGDPTLVGDAATGFGAGVEAMLDIETVTGVAGNVAAEFWGFDGTSPDNPANEPFLKWLAQVSSTPDSTVPNLFSTSYGEDEDSWSLDAASRLNVEFQKAGARGISLLFASGDSGANCQGGRFKPNAPASSPWVTAVGGTEGVDGLSAIGLGSGGFSDRWPLPEWQADAVKAYLNSGAKLPARSTGYNVSNRAFPDIAAQASDFTVVANRVQLPGVAGTSCAAPSASAVIALLNDARLQAGKSPLGFLNPFIYANQDKWNDVAKGSNSGGACGIGWPALTGWDAATGVGSPNYARLVQAALALP